MRALWLAEVLRAGGLTVVEHDGWESRGFQPWEPRYGIVHATAAPRTQADDVQVAIVRDGRTGLPGPIANACVDRSGRWHVLASGRCNTALTGWAGPAAGLGNANLLGVEACNDNVSEPWPAVQLDAYVRGWAAIARQLGWDAGRLVGHKEHQPGDKTDPLFDMAEFRAGVVRLLEGEDGDMAGWLTDQRAETLFWRVEALQTNRPAVAGGQTAGERNAVHDALQDLSDRIGVLETGGISPDALVQALVQALADPQVRAVLVQLAEQGAQQAEDR